MRIHVVLLPSMASKKFKHVSTVLYIDIFLTHAISRNQSPRRTLQFEAIAWVSLLEHDTCTFHVDRESFQKRDLIQYIHMNDVVEVVAVVVYHTMHKIRFISVISAGKPMQSNSQANVAIFVAFFHSGNVVFHYESFM